MLHFRIISPERVVYEEDVEQVTVPGKDGELTILENHIPLVSALQAGELVVKKNGTVIPMAISGGFLEVQPKSRVTVLADTAEKVEEIDEKRAEEARKRAADLMQQKVSDRREYAMLAAKMEKELARLRVARKHRTHVRSSGAVAP